MKKDDFVRSLAEKLDITQVKAREVLGSFNEVIDDALVSGKRVPLDVGFVEVRERAARKGVNPQTGEEMEISARKAVALKQREYGKKLVN